MYVWFVREEFVDNFIFKWIRANLFVIVCTQLNGFKYCYRTLIILFYIIYCFHSAKWFQVLCTQLNGLNYCYLTPIIIFKLLIHLHKIKWFHVFLFNTNNFLHKVKRFQLFLSKTNNTTTLGLIRPESKRNEGVLHRTQDTRWKYLTPLLKYSRRILQRQANGLKCDY